MLISVTNRLLCHDDFLERISLIASNKPYMIILREKDMNKDDYILLACKVMEICSEYNVKFAVNSFVDAARKIHAENIHVPLKMLAENTALVSEFHTGVSVHSPQEAAEACKLGAEYLIAGHIFATDCKKNLPPRGLDYLKEVVKASDVPVFGIGGINKDNMHMVTDTGASGFCVMSELMSCSEDNFPYQIFC